MIINKKHFTEKIDFIVWEEEGVCITRIYPVSLFMEDRKEGRKAAFLTDRCYRLEEFNKELDKFQRDIEDLRKRAKKKYDKFKTKDS